jgi:hypothetical protein
MATVPDHIDFNLDDATRDQTFKPFAFTWKGKKMELSDPAELDYRKLLEVETPLHFLRYTASQETRDFLASPEGTMEAWRLNKLMEAYYRHFGMDKDRSKLGF